MPGNTNPQAGRGTLVSSEGKHSRAKGANDRDEEMAWLCSSGDVLRGCGSACQLLGSES